MKVKFILLFICFLVLGACLNEDKIQKMENYHPTKIVIERKGKLQSITHQPPAEYQVDTMEMVTSIYESLLNLKAVPKDVIIHCPADFGISYDLAFYEDGNQLFTANVEAGGCRYVQFQEKEAYQSTDSFWKLMKEATGMTESQLWGTPGSF
ncbi:hypothetical protein [Paenibacillus glycanilyticus]|uniref:hypothetical protein n=1 Tax=Paenibacillus glycanilyticus TaxID=126569 RepID=UPI00191085E9|nr:hypothetical protein [Paenibacillus glycanilyticus]